MWRGTGLVLITAILGAIGGCGGGDGSSTSGSGNSPSEDAFIARADAVCQRIFAETGPLADRFEELKTLGASGSRSKQVAHLIHRTGAILDKEEPKLAALRPPPEDKAAVDRWLAIYQRDGPPILNQLAGAYEAGDDARAQQLEGELGKDVLKAG
jgi:hypothetical protein